MEKVILESWIEYHTTPTESFLGTAHRIEHEIYMCNNCLWHMREHFALENGIYVFKSAETKELAHKSQLK